MIKRNPVIKRNNGPVKFIQLNGDSAKRLKKRLYVKAGGKCPVLGKKVKVRDTVLDHKHKLKIQKPGPLGRGLARGAIHFQVNAFEGVMLKKYKRYGLRDMMPLPDLLESLAEYIRNPPCEQIYIYPSEKPKSPTFGKRDYARIVKYYMIIHPRAKKAPAYPKSGIKKVGKKKKGQKQKYKYVAKLSTKWQTLLDAANSYFNKEK